MAISTRTARASTAGGGAQATGAQGTTGPATVTQPSPPGTPTAQVPATQLALVPAQPPLPPQAAPLPPVPAPGHQVPQPQQQGGVYAPTYFGGNLPAPREGVATLFSNATLPDQRTAAASFFAFLQDPTTDLRDLNADTSQFTALIAVPGTHKVKLLYGMGIGTAAIGQTSPIANKVLTLYGEGGFDIGPPTVLMLDSTVRDKRMVKSLTEADIEATLQAGNHRETLKLASARDVNTEANIMLVAPCPPYFMYDGFDKDLNAVMVYERLRECQHPSPMLDHALAFLRSVMIGSWRGADQQPVVPLPHFQAMLPPDARKWGQHRFQQLCPNLTAPPAAAAPFQPAAPAIPAAAPVQQAQGGTVYHMDAAAMQQLLQHATAHPAAATTAAAAPTDSTADFKVSAAEKVRMKTMCGIDQAAGDEAYPKWFRDIFAKNLDEKDRIIIIASAIEKSVMFEDAEVPLYTALLKMILKRDWTASDVGKRAALMHAAKGLTAFAMMDLSEEDIATMAQDHDDLAGASAVTVADFRANRAKLKPQTPRDAEGFLLMLKRYTNLIFALFSADCPLYQEMYGIVKALRSYSPAARANISHEAKTAILWIILLQSRRFSQGKMEGATGRLGEFTNMVNHIRSKSCATISHIEVPSELLVETKTTKPKLKRGAAPESSDDDTRGAKTPDKKRKQDNPNRIVQPYSSTLKDILSKPLEQAGTPGLRKICEYCNISLAQLLPELGPKDCKQFLTMGTCMMGTRCRFHHREANKAQITAIKTKLKRFIDDPLGLPGKKES